MARLIDNFNDIRITHRWERTDSPDYDEPQIRCCECGCEGELRILDKFYCIECAEVDFKEYLDDLFDEDEEIKLFTCEGCDAQLSDEVFKVGGDLYCRECFLEMFKI